MVQVKDVAPKTSNAKKNITIKGAKVDKLIFYDETGNVTQEVLDAIPDGIKELTVKISIEIEKIDDQE